MAHCKHFDCHTLYQQENQPGLDGKIATHHLRLYRLVADMAQPLVLEFGVDRGRSTCVFLQACEETGGHLYSLDVRDCSDVATSPAWTFLQQSDLAQDALFERVPTLRGGIDLLHIDSLHERGHVGKLLMLWYPYVKQNGYITFHDVDPTPYLAGQRKDNPRHEPEAVGISEIIREFFYANEDELFLEYHFGSTGMGILRKLAPLGATPRPPVRIRSRQAVITPAGLFWTGRHALRKLVRRVRPRAS